MNITASPQVLDEPRTPDQTPGSTSDSAWAQVPAAGPSGTDESLYLVGRPTLKQFVRFVHNSAVDPPGDGVLFDEWRAASEVVRTLQKDEAGLADYPVIEKLGPEYQPLLIEFLKDPLVRHGFNTVPAQVAFVDLDRLVVYQKHIDLTFVRDLQQRLGPAPGADQVFRVCLPFDHPQPPVRWKRKQRNSFVFVSPSNDLRFLGAMRLQPGNIADYPPPGSLVGVVGLAVGFGSNFLNAIYFENRLILNNGSHRACALRGLGIKRVPCIVQHPSTRTELEYIADTAVEERPDAFLKDARPPMLRDYFDPRLRKIMPVHRQLRQVTVTFSVDEGYVPAI